MITSEGIHNLWFAKPESNLHKDDTSLGTDTHRVYRARHQSVSKHWQLLIGFHMHTIWTNLSFNYLVIVSTHGWGWPWHLQGKDSYSQRGYTQTAFGLTTAGLRQCVNATRWRHVNWQCFWLWGRFERRVSLQHDYNLILRWLPVCRSVVSKAK